MVTSDCSKYDFKKLECKLYYQNICKKLGGGGEGGCPAWKMYRLPNQELTTRFLTSNIMKHNPDLTQYKCGRMKPVWLLQQLWTGN